MLGSEHLELRATCHGAVLVHDLADDAGRRQARQPSEIDGGLGVPGALEHATGTRLQREDVAGHRDVLGLGVTGDRGRDRDRAIRRRDARGDLALGSDRAVKRRALLGGVLVGHGRDAERSESLTRQRHADEAAAVARHEVDGLGRDLLGGHDEVAFVLAVLVVDHDEHAACANLGDGLLDRRRTAGGSWRRSSTAALRKLA